MPYVPPSVVQEVKRMDLLIYLKNYEPYESVHFSSNTYTTRTHDSLKISNGKWMWWSQRTGGRSALDYLIKARGYSFFEAVELLAEQANIQPPLSVSENIPMEKQKSCDTVRLFESAIVPLSYATLQKLDGKEWRREHLLSLAGVYQPAKEIEKSKVLAALTRILKMQSEVKVIVLHLVHR